MSCFASSPTPTDPNLLLPSNSSPFSLSVFLPLVPTWSFHCDGHSLDLLLYTTVQSLILKPEKKTSHRGIPAWASQAKHSLKTCDVLYYRQTWKKPKVTKKIFPPTVYPKTINYTKSMVTIAFGCNTVETFTSI